MADQSGPRGLLTLVCLTCGNEKFYDQSVPQTVTCERCGGTVFRNFATPTEPDEASIAQIVSGIGFLGAGAILHAHGAVLGLTTAATIWVVAAVGAAVGAGAYVESVGTSLLIILVLVGLRPLERGLLHRRRKVSATVRVQRDLRFDVIEDILRGCGLHIVSRRSYEHESDRAFDVELIGTSKQIDEAVDELRRRQDVISLTVD